MKKLSDLIQGLPELLDVQGDMDTEIGSITSSSRDNMDRGLFFCIKGARFDAHDYAAEALEHGCVALVVERFLPLPVPQVRVSHGRSAMARMAGAFYDWPSRKMKIFGITGTKGKTTTTDCLPPHHTGSCGTAADAVCHGTGGRGSGGHGGQRPCH